MSRRVEASGAASSTDELNVRVAVDVEHGIAPEGVATIVHELKTPITSMLGYARMVRLNWPRLTTERRDEYFEIMERQGRRLLGLIEDLLESARLDAGPKRLRRKPVDLNALIAATTDTVRGLSAGHCIALDIPRHAVVAFGDVVALEHVVTNLLENAVKYSPAGSLVRIELEEHESEVRISVSDEGSGIAAADLPHVFERFRRGDDTGEAGAGLGLYIVRSLVAAHGGRVWVRSEPGAGTTFTFSLPRRAGRER